MWAELHAAGLTAAQAAAARGSTEHAARSWSARHGVTWADAKIRIDYLPRVRRLVAQGHSYAHIARVIGVSRERIRQVVKAYNVT